MIWREIQAEGYDGGITVVRKYVTPKRALRASKATVRFETAAGKQMQSDWGEVTTLVGGVETKVYFQVNTLGYSRRFHFWCTGRADAEHTYEGLIRSFEYFGGVTAGGSGRQPESAWSSGTRRPAARSSTTRFVDFAAHYGFTPRACRPYRPRTKGKDERMVGLHQAPLLRALSRASIAVSI